MMREGFDRMMAAIRSDAAHRVASHYHQDARAAFDPVRKAMIVAAALDYMGIEIPEARELVGEIKDLVMQVESARQLTPTLRNFL